MARVGSRPGAVWLRDMLRQAITPYPQAKLDEIADSLMTRAMEPASADQKRAAYASAVDALNALVASGSRGPWNGRPYAGAFDRMIALHRRAPSLRIRARALSGMLASPSHARAVGYLRDVAESSDVTAYDAVFLLISDANGGSWSGIQPTASQRQESIAAVKALQSRGRVTDTKAANILEGWIVR
jgi:hypothetical protein